ncbi:hypothetical protein AGABI1DRAFT_115113 [Agaricus bisporus var. burnettii JB137-S8]|uniref:Nucleoside phosphorylase domain-containing protein n=1 Tax=Agaricus bisporus var. burnettii (strain JB137-S8 / ATCC MYA-4627 / FGSC 10392) TaxID=597362 RepID=K5X2Z4_AGABU|nr:uncharacterized protein AGABI1DRAFT_115113 [Agaricus bisporus var. burnettii JB137-S8]EKM77528.1 hypothetical protein AGABI1DRAFT_115113 [Agaricus bisporus var. burnettii JB137-S8]
MKDTLTDANFPKTAHQRVYHLGIRHGEVANRIITVGTPSRARIIAQYLDKNPQPFEVSSERGFLTITGRYLGVPLSIISIGMGSPNMDFFVREVRECLRGDMIIVRLGSCGALIDVPVGSVVVPKACISVNRNLDFDFVHPGNQGSEPPYRISKPVSADQALHQKLVRALEIAKPADWSGSILPGSVNASADSFYSSQGRQTTFPDHNSGLIEELLRSTPDLATLEMETFHLYHLAACWTGRSTARPDSTPPVTAGPVKPVTSGPMSSAPHAPASSPLSETSIIRAAGVQMIFAARLSKDFITPAQVTFAENWTGKAVLDALAGFEIAPEHLDEERGSVWESQS